MHTRRPQPSIIVAAPIASKMFHMDKKGVAHAALAKESVSLGQRVPMLV
jgi:hypothetical protein